MKHLPQFNSVCMEEMSSNDDEDRSLDKTESNNTISSCCCGCAEQFVKLINLCISTAYSNRFLQEITGKDVSMQHVSDLLGSISVALHFLASELSAHILNVEPHLNHFKIFDPKYPSWKGDPTKFVLEGNKVVVVAIEHFLSLLKVHDHTTERSLLKKLIRNTKLIFLWDELEKLLLAEIELDSDSQRGESEKKIKNEDQSTSTRSVESRNNPQDQRLQNNVKTEPLNLSEEENKPVLPSQASNQIQESFKKRSQIKDSANQTSEEDILRNLNFSFMNDPDEFFDPKVTSSARKEPEVETEDYPPREDKNISVEEEHIKESNSEDSSSSQDSYIGDKASLMENDKESKEDVREELTDNSIEYNVDKRTVSGKDFEGSVFFLVFDVPIQSNTLTITDSEVEAFLRAAHWIFAYGGTVKVPKKYLDYKFLKDLTQYNKLSAWNGAPWELPDEIDLIISVGGSGNFDNSSLEFGKEIPPVIKFDVKEEEDPEDNPLEPWELKRRISERTMELRRMRLGLRLETLGELTILRTAMNEVTLMKMIPPNPLRVRVDVDNVLLDEFEADGLVIASPTGSNRISKRFGGPLVSPGLECIIITPVAIRRMTPFIVSPRSRITVTLPEVSHSAYSASASVEFDGNYVGTLDKDGRLEVRAADFFLEELVDKNDSEIKMLSSMKH